MAQDTTATRPAQSFYVETFGCQMNVHDSEKVAGMLIARGYWPAASAAEADLVFLNTCSIREKAEQKVYSRLGQLKADVQRGKKVVGVLGCMAQLEGEKIFAQAPFVSLVCGSASYRKLPDLLVQIDNGARATGLTYDDEAFETEFTRRDNPCRAYITIIEGCDKTCAYCVVPFTRGPERSRSSASILREVEQLVAGGYTEVQLLGQNVSSYRDPSARRMSFAELLAAVGDVPGIRRVRFTTSHPRDFTADIVAAIDAQPTLCEHVHLPVQSGSTAVLRRMQRGYTCDEYLERIALIRAARRAISITTDIIVGFPSESEQDYEETLDLLAVVGYDGVFSFKYSPRPNTPALQLDQQVPEEEKGRRLIILQERQRQMQQERNRALIGQTFEIVVEGHNPRQGNYLGRLRTNRVVSFEGTDVALGSYRQVQIARAGATSLAGELIT